MLISHQARSSKSYDINCKLKSKLRKLGGIKSGVITLCSLSCKSIDGHVSHRCVAKAFAVTPSENFPKESSGEAACESEHNAPSPPLEEFSHPIVRFSTRGLFKEIYDVPPKMYIVEVAVNSPPRGNRRKRKTYLPVYHYYLSVV